MCKNRRKHNDWKTHNPPDEAENQASLVGCGLSNILKHLIIFHFRCGNHLKKHLIFYDQAPLKFADK